MTRTTDAPEIQFTTIDKREEHYVAASGERITREYGKTPNGNAMAGRWVLRSASGEMIDFDGYINDLTERNNLRLLY